MKTKKKMCLMCVSKMTSASPDEHTCSLPPWSVQSGSPRVFQSHSLCVANLLNLSPQEQLRHTAFQFLALKPFCCLATVFPGQMKIIYSHR